MNARQTAIVIAALRIIMVTVRDEGRPFYIQGHHTRVSVRESEKLLEELEASLSKELAG